MSNSKGQVRKRPISMITSFFKPTIQDIPIISEVEGAAPIILDVQGVEPILPDVQGAVPILPNVQGAEPIIPDAQVVHPIVILPPEHNEAGSTTPATRNQAVGPIEVDINTSFERGPGLRPQICQYNVNQRSLVRREYLHMGPYRVEDVDYSYPLTFDGRQNRAFNRSWVDDFSWLEYSPAKDRVFCFPCFVFEKNTPKSPQFTVDGFQNWKRVNNGSKCSFLQHMGGPNSPHRVAVSSCQNLMNPRLHIDNVMNVQMKEEVLKNRLRLKTSIEAIRLLSLQGCSFRGHDESIHSENRGMFIELLKYAAKLNDVVASVILENAPGNATYTCPDVQKQILHIMGERVRMKIREEVGNAKFCILVDEAQDNSDKEQMEIILRFVDDGGYIRERFFQILSVEDTSSLTLKNKISSVLSHYNLQVCNMRGQGYDGANNMRGSWNGLQALFLEECPYAYFVHCFAHRLQLALVASCEDEPDVWSFFSSLGKIIKLIGASPKRKMQLHTAQENQRRYLLAINELETGTGKNQTSNVQQAGSTRWSSHYASVSSLLELYKASCTVLEGITAEGSTNKIRGEAKGVYFSIRSFDFIFMLHLVSKTMGITEVLCQSLQVKAQDIVNAMSLVRTSKELLQKLSQTGWDSFFADVVSFCLKHGVVMPKMSDPYIKGTGRSCQQEDNITIEHHYHFDIFAEVIAYQVMELNNRFPKKAVELLTLSSALDPTNGFQSFNIDDICTLAEKFYPEDFTKQEIHILRCELEHYEQDVLCNDQFTGISTIPCLCQRLVETRKSKTYGMVDRIIRLVLTLPVSTATTERAFSAMKLVKTQLRNKIGDELLGNCMVIYIEKEAARKIDSDSVIDEFDTVKNRRVQFR